MDNYVPVLTTKGRPLAPCHPQRAHSLVRAGKARFKHRYGIRCIVLTRTNVPKLREHCKLQLRIDPGAKHTGIAITRDSTDGSRAVGLALVINHRGRTIKSAMTKRRQMRRGRRYRKTRYRKPRFNNRTRPAGWLPPSLLSRLQNTLTWVRRLSKLLPITELHVETSVFDPQLLRDPEIQGIEYQQGPLYRTNLRAAVLHRDGNKCVYCKRSGKRQQLELDHIVPRSNGGTNRYDNLVAACRPCNQKRGNQPIEQWLKRRPKKLAEVQAKLGTELADATHMNVILPRLLQALRNDGWTVVAPQRGQHCRRTPTLLSGEIPPRRRRHDGLPSQAPLHADGTNHHRRHRTRQPSTHHARPERYSQRRGIPGILPATKAHPEENTHAGPQETRQARLERCHRRLRPIHPPGQFNTRLRSNQQPTSGTDQTKMEKRQGRPSYGHRTQPRLPG